MHKLTCKWASLAILTLAMLMNTCVAETSKPNMTTQHNTERKLVAGELIVNAVKDAEMLGVEMFADGMERPFYSRAKTKFDNTAKLSFPLPRIPQQVRVIWRKTYQPVWAEDGGISFKGELAGDYTIPVASRIPPTVFEEIQRNGGALRIKFRLKPDGVMLGWDIQRMGKHLLKSYMPGGDFLDTEY